MRAGIIVTVTPEDRSRLEAIVSDRNRAQKHVARARVLLATGEGLGTMEIMARSGLSKPAVWRWQARYMAEGVEGLLRDKTRKPGKAPLAPETVARVVELTLGEAPGKTTHWTSRAMAKLVGVGVISVQRIWKANGLTPHRMRTFKLAKDPLFVQKFSDVVGLYVEPPAHAVVLSVGEKSQIQALDRTPVEAEVPSDKAVHVILDNYATHKHPKVRAWLARHPRWTFHFTPTSASWLNAVEGFFSALTRRRLKRGVFVGVVDLQAAINRYVREHNADPRPFTWTADPQRVIAAVTVGTKR